MSKCKAVLDGEKITEIRIKAKTQQTDSQKGEPEQKRSVEPKQILSVV